MHDGLHINYTIARLVNDAVRKPLQVDFSIVLVELAPSCWRLRDQLNSQLILIQKILTKLRTAAFIIKSSIIKLSFSVWMKKNAMHEVSCGFDRQPLNYLGKLLFQLKYHWNACQFPCAMHPPHRFQTFYLNWKSIYGQ